LRFGDATRSFLDGTLWVWSQRGRPYLLASVERYEKNWSFELVSLGETALEVEEETGWRWKPPGSAVGQRPMPEAPSPANESPARQRQARELARRFEVVELFGEGNERISLRLQPRAIHEYRDPERGLLEGAFFVFSNGTNPEALLILEAVHQDGAPADWRYGFAPLSAAAMQAQLEGAQVWSIPPVRQARLQAPYTLFALPLSDEDRAFSQGVQPEASAP
jgi:hypothetical protein